ncbi:DDB1- and CUL4-associated factor 8-like isoform X2 [Aethina tumida]|uniref:DDB1- and CUL4-associated factor 8-like isoform X2 n=1 Tax=Aethina tumida TaxID=116153 RepID=UPI00096B17F2|nr:DDB1- and CUL4-associated factor 8-like isoform X2 [Aethina tumida]
MDEGNNEKQHDDDQGAGDSNDNAKRMKTEEKSEESSSSSNNTEQESASTSVDSGFPRSRNSKYRNYRTRTQEANNDEDSPESDRNSDSAELEPMEADNVPDRPASSPDSSDSTVIISESDIDSESEECSVLKKKKPKHNWFVIQEVLNRQVGHKAKLQGSELFQRRCYGSLRSVQRLELMYKLEEHDGCVNSLNFHPDGSLLASGSDDLKVCIWDWKIGKCMLKFDTKHRGNVFQSRFLNLTGDLHIATCARDGQIRLVRVAREEGVRENRKMGSHRGPCHKLTVLKDQPQVFMSAGEDGLVLSHDVRRQKPTKVVNVKESEREVALYSIHSHPLRTNEFVVGGRHHMVRTYDMRKTDQTLGRYYPFEGSDSHEFGSLHVTCAVYNHDGSEILASYNDADIYLFDVNASKRGTYMHRYQGHRNGATIKGVNFFGPKSEFIVSGSDCGNVFFWERNTEAIVQWMFADNSGVVNVLEPHPQLPYICTSGLDYDVKVWVPSSEQEPEMKQLPQCVMDNTRSRVLWTSGGGSGNEVLESRMLWMLWRHLHLNRFRDEGNASNLLAQLMDSSSGDSSGNSSSHDDDDDEENDGNPAGCSTS